MEIWKRRFWFLRKGGTGAGTVAKDRPGPFSPLTKEEEVEVEKAFNSDSNKVLATHNKSGIQVTVGVLRCLRPQTWLSDEIINLYFELLKERESRHSDSVKLHFFNTFFYEKLAGKKYDYSAVRRWTKELEYKLMDCDKIFVPIHTDNKKHWCLGVINCRERRFQLLDSLGPGQLSLLENLARYFVDEVSDKSATTVDLRTWKHETVDAPKQKNLYDCGMFVIKCADFYSRGSDLCFTQEHILLFRKRTAVEVLRLKAD